LRRNNGLLQCNIAVAGVYGKPVAARLPREPGISRLGLPKGIAWNPNKIWALVVFLT